MIDPLFVLALLAVAFFKSFYLATAAWMFLLFLGCIAIVRLFLFEGAAQFIAPRLQRAVIDFRFKPARGLPKLIKHLSLDRPLSPEQLQDGARQLASAAHAVTMRHPNPLFGPVRLKKLETAFEGGIHPANAGFLKDLRKAWITPQPGLSPGGWSFTCAPSSGACFLDAGLPSQRRRRPRA